MKEQNYKNHIMFYPPHHFIFLPLLAVLFFTGLYKSFTADAEKLIWILFTIVIFCIIYLTLMLRQHYALGNQDRIIVLEFKQRYFELYNQRSDEIAEKLSFSQIAALRFAYDEEFKELLQKTLEENLSGKEIKQSIKHWRADNRRV